MKSSNEKRILVLCGMKHCGKSTLGKLLAEAYRCTFYDVDDVIETLSNKSCRELYQKYGEATFKSCELEASVKIVQDLCQKEEDHGSTKDFYAVVACGGGICDNKPAIEVLKTCGLLTYLCVDERISFDRIITSSKKTGSWPAYITKELSSTSLKKLERDSFFDDEAVLKEAASIFHDFYTKRTKKYAEIADVLVPIGSGQKKDNVQYVMDIVSQCA